MKRIYRNNDLVFNLTVNGFPFKPELIEKVEFRFYTLNKENYIKKTEADIKDSAITLEWIDLGTLEEGVLYYSYNLSVFTEDLSDKYQNTTDNVMTNYFLLTGKSEIDIEQTKSQWGLIEGDITNQRDLVDYIDLGLTTKQDTLVSGNNIKTINGESIVGSGDLVIEGGGSVDLTDYYKKSETYSKQQIDDKGYLTEHQDISGKLDTSVYNNDKSTFALKTELPTKVSQLENDSKYLIEQDISGKVDNETYTAEKKEFLTLVDKKADKTELSDMATKTWVGNEKFLKSVPAEYITETELTQKNYATKSELGSKLDTTTYTEDKKTLATKDELKGKLDTSVYNNDKSNFATKDDLGKKQETLVGTETVGQNLKTINGETLLGTGNITISGGSQGGAVDSVNGKTGTVVITAEDLGALTSIPEEYVTDTELNQKGYLTEHQDISGKLDTSVYNEDKKTFALKTELPDTSNLATKEELGEKLDTSTYNQDKPTFALKSEIPSTDNFATKDDLSNKQDVLLSGVNIKTINGADILGSGDIVIEGGGGSDNGVGKKDPDVWDGSGEIFNNYESNRALGQYSHAEGNGTRATNNYSHAEGQGSGAEGEGSHAEGTVTTALGGSSHSEGYLTSANGLASHAEGGNNTAYNACEHVQGNYCTEETDKYSEFNPAGSIFKIGNGTETGGRSDALRMLGNGKTWIAGVGDFTGTNPTETNTLQSVLNGKQDTLVGTAVEGQNIKTINGETLLGTGDIKVEGGSGGGGVGEKDLNTVSSGFLPEYTPEQVGKALGEIFNSYEDNEINSYTIRKRNIATGVYSHAEGVSNTVTGYESHVEGSNNTCGAFSSHIEGSTNTCDGGYNVHIEGWQNVYSGRGGCHIEGFYHTSNYGSGSIGEWVHIEGVNCEANNYAEHVQGRSNNTNGEYSEGSYNIEYSTFQVGNGSGDRLYSTTSNALDLKGNGNLWIAGKLNQTGADYAEMFEWLDKNPENEDRVGYFVTLKEDRIVKATGTDNYILGIISAFPAVLGDNPNLWHDQYINDKWGRPIYEDVEVTYKEGDVEKTRVDHIRKVNPEWKSKTIYVDRTNRPEWDAVGLVGKLLVRQDGTLTPGSFCKSNDSGIATKSESGYYVMKVIDKEQALVMFK